MKLIKLNKTKKEELFQKNELNENRRGYLEHTRNYYLLKKNKESFITSKMLTLVELESKLNLNDYSTYTLEEEKAKEVLVNEKPVVKKSTPKKTEVEKVKPKKSTSSKKEEVKKPETKNNKKKSAK